MATLSDNKWIIENQKNNQAISVTITENKQSVNIFKCEGSVVTVKGKCTSVSIEGSKKCGVIFDDLIAVAEVTNCQGVQLQANGVVPNITVDKSSGITVYVQSEAGKKAEIITSASTEVNVVTPGKTENDDPLEQPIPSQFVSTFGADGKLSTKPTEHVGV